MLSNKNNSISSIAYAHCFNSFIFAEKNEIESRPLIKMVSVSSLLPT
jgi:hypothetical protein